MPPSKSRHQPGRPSGRSRPVNARPVVRPRAAPQRPTRSRRGLDLGLDWDWLRPPPHASYLAGWVLLPLRAFLGITFVFAGLQKLANPAFFDATNPASIQAQLAGAQRISPIHSLIGPLTHVAVPLGLLIAFGELAAGLGTILGLWARVAAVGGLILSFMLFLTVSYHSHPYYTGSDIVFVFAWMPLVIAGAGGVLSADALLAQRERRRMGAEPAAIVPIPFALARRECGSFEDGSCQARNGAPCAPGPCPYLAQQPPRPKRIDQNEIDRRTFVAKGVVAGAVSAVALLAGGVAAGVGRLTKSSSGDGTPSLGGSASPSTTPPPSSTPSSTVQPTTTTTAAQHKPPGTKVGPARDVPVGGAAQFSDPSTGDPSLVVQPQSGSFIAFDAVCPHAGCTVQYDGNSKLFICPCHGSEFNGSTGAVELGPAQTGLKRLTIAEGSDGQLYVT
jgi:thiosulfate dehydrogenase (quinone) large subunit